MAEKPEEPIDPLSENIMAGRLCEEAQRKNVIDENNDEKDKLMMLVDFVNQNAEASFVIQYKNYGFNKVYNKGLHENDPFVQQNQSNLEKYGKCLDFDKSQQILKENIVLVCQQVFDYLVSWSINIGMDDDYVGMARVSNQALIIQFILKLIEDTKGDPVECTEAFFKRLTTEKQYCEEFVDELYMLKHRIDKCAREQNETVEAGSDDEAKTKN